MITALLLIFAPVATWQRIARAARGLPFIMAIYLLPLLVLASAGEGYGLVHWGKEVGDISRLKKFPVNEVIIFELGQVVLSLVVVFICAGLTKSAGTTFHGRHTFTQAFATMAYGLGPFFLLRLTDAFTGMSPWLSWGIGVVFAASALYHGVPPVMQPDPAHAFGLYMISSLLTILTTGLAELLTWCFLQGKFPRVAELVTDLAARLPF